MDALFRHELVAPVAGGQFQCPDEHGFDADRGWIHRAEKLNETLAAGTADASLKPAGRKIYLILMIRLVRRFRFVQMKARCHDAQEEPTHMNPMKRILTTWSPGRYLPVALAALALVVTGCPHNEYIVELKPQGATIQRTLTYSTGDTNELSAIAALYPAPGSTNANGGLVIQGVFSNALPADVGGAGGYTYLPTNLGAAAFYEERFRGNDDLAGMAAKRARAADQMTDLLLGWSRAELRRESDYGKLRQFLDVDFRRDLKNLSDYWWEGQLVSNYKTNANEEFIVRFGQYLSERGYLTIDDLPGLIREANSQDSKAMRQRIQRLVARKMGVPDTDPLPARLAFLAEDATMEKSLTNYLAGTDLYQAKLKQWKQDVKLKPDTKRPEPGEEMDEAYKNLVDFDLLGSPDHLTVELSLQAAPVHSNGQWDEMNNQEIWNTYLGDEAHLPVACFAIWVQPDEAFQTAHLGKLALTGDDLTSYCLWRKGLDADRGGVWDAFVAGLQPGADLTNQLAAFRFPDETKTTGTNKPSSLADLPRQLLEDALKPRPAPHPAK